VADPELLRDGVRDVAVSLHRHHGVARIQLTLVQVRHELVERLGADAAREAVFEEQQWPLVGRGERPIEIVDTRERFQSRVHFLSVAMPAKPGRGLIPGES
jgi:hypothetical protein